MERSAFKEIKDLHNDIIRKRIDMNKGDIKIPNYTQLEIIKYLTSHDNEPTYQKDFEKILNIRKSTISGILDTMEKNKIIKRTSSKTDGRGKLVYLSKEALAMQKEFKDHMDNLEKELLEGIDEEDMSTFFKVLDRIKANINKKGQ